MNYDLSVVIPALNEEANIQRAIEDVIDAFYRLKISGEIIVVNDGSIDHTEEIVNKIAENNSFISIIHHNKPKGIGASFWAGVLKSQSNLVTLLPGDGEGNAYELLQYLPLMKQVDLVIPFVYNVKEVRSFLRRVLSKIYTKIINFSFGMSLNYTNGFVIYRKSVLRSILLKNSGFFYQAELLVKCLRRGYLYAEVPIALKPRRGGSSSALNFKALWKVLWGYLLTLITIYAFERRDKSIVSDSVTACKRQEIRERLYLDGKRKELF